jgi:cell division septum initiation protein DivIVA
MRGEVAAESDLAILTDAELDEIEARAVARIEIQAIPESESVLAALIDNVRKDIPQLVAEIRRLRAENDRLRETGGRE